jgi:hypothetical protein
MEVYKRRVTAYLAVRMEDDGTKNTAATGKPANGSQSIVAGAAAGAAAVRFCVALASSSSEGKGGTEVLGYHIFCGRWCNVLGDFGTTGRLATSQRMVDESRIARMGIFIILYCGIASMALRARVLCRVACAYDLLLSWLLDAFSR